MPIARLSLTDLTSTAEWMEYFRVLQATECLVLKSDETSRPTFEARTAACAAPFARIVPPGSEDVEDIYDWTPERIAATAEVFAEFACL